MPKISKELILIFHIFENQLNEAIGTQYQIHFLSTWIKESVDLLRSNILEFLGESQCVFTYSLDLMWLELEQDGNHSMALYHSYSVV